MLTYFITASLSPYDADICLFSDAADLASGSPSNQVRDFSGTAGDGDQLNVSAFGPSFIGNGAFTRTPGQVRSGNTATDTIVFADTDGD